MIDKHRNLFWYTPDDQKHDISDALLVERILNDGTLDDCRELIQVLGGKRVAEVFFSATGRQKQNYYPEIYHFFSLVLRKLVRGLPRSTSGRFYSGAEKERERVRAKLKVVVK